MQRYQRSKLPFEIVTRSQQLEPSRKLACVQLNRAVTLTNRDVKTGALNQAHRAAGYYREGAGVCAWSYHFGRRQKQPAIQGSIVKPKF
jgi:hypothetical protein